MVARTEHRDSLTFRRLGGTDVQRMMDGKNATDLAISLATGLTPAKFALLKREMDSADLGAAEQIINELLGDVTKPGLPPHAQETDEGIRLPLYFPADDGAGQGYTELLFKRMNGADRQAIAQAADTLSAALHRSTGMTPKTAKELIRRMDGIDAVAAQRVIGFLSGSGRPTGR